MQTQDFIEMLARGAGPAPQAVVPRRLAPVMALGLALSCALALGLIGPLPPSAFLTPTPWSKLGYACALAAAAALLTARLARPFSRVAPTGFAVSVIVAVMALVGAVSLAMTPSGERAAAVLGQTWRICPWMVVGLSMPTLIGLLWALRGLAPTRPGDAGFAAGLLAGAIGAAGYSLACPESSMAFVAIWYTLGIVLTAVLGRALGPWLLRW